MPAWDPTRWTQNPDGSHSRRSGDPNVRSGKPVYVNMTRDRLVAEAGRRGLPKYGSKADLVARLKRDDG